MCGRRQGLGHQPEAKDAWRHPDPEEAGWTLPPLEPLEGARPADTLIADFWPLLEKFLLF